MRQQQEMHETRNCVVLVLGMHRSGTSGLTGSLGILGCGLPSSQIPKSNDNPKGFFESRPVAYFNDDLLKSGGLSWKDWAPMRPEWFSAKSTGSLKTPAATLINEEFGAAPIFAMKDPRICRLFPFWKKVFQASGVDVVVLHAHRHPMDVAKSLMARDKLPLSQGLLLWIGHVLQAERDSRGCRRSFNRFGDLLANPVDTLRLVQDRLGIRFPHPPERKRQDLAAFLTPDQRHHQTTTTDELPTMIRTVYDILNRWADSGEDTTDHATLDRIHDCLIETLRDAADPETLLLALRLVGAERAPEPQDLADLDQKALTALTGVLARTGRHLNQVLQKKDSRLSDLSNAVNAGQETLAENARHIEQETFVRRQLEARNDVLQQQMSQMRPVAELATAQELAARRAHEIDALNQQIAQAQHDRDALLNSTIWRSTAPLRRLIGALKRGKQAGSS
jgi:hypothetical protein|tara:strand:+ start:357 stop:1706 length:1350 start_codon:yes stop_codon:yes gene_type:complete